jgi:carboxymethylenebutenolidase
LCYAIDAAPPIAPLDDRAVTCSRFVLSSDGDVAYRAFTAVPASADASPKAGVIVLPDVRGLCGFYEHFAVRLAEQSLSALVVDYYGRTAGTGERAPSFPYMEHAARLRPQQIQADIGAAAAHLRSAAAGSPPAIFVVGFCLGGKHAWLAAAEDHGLAGAAGFYGSPRGGGSDGAPGPLSCIERIRAPILALQAGADEIVPVEENALFEEALRTAGSIEFEIVVYPGAPHSFFDQGQDDYREASADAWRRLLSFLAAHGGGTPDREGRVV